MTNKWVIHNQALLFLALFAKKRLWTDGTWTDTRRMTMESQREGMWLKTVLALHYSQQKLLWKRQWSKRGQRKWVTNAISASIKPAKDRISVDTNTISITDLNLKWEEGNERLVLFLEQLNIEEQQKIRTSLHRERSRILERMWECLSATCSKFWNSQNVKVGVHLKGSCVSFSKKRNGSCKDSLKSGNITGQYQMSPEIIRKIRTFDNDRGTNDIAQGHLIVTSQYQLSQRDVLRTFDID